MKPRANSVTPLLHRVGVRTGSGSVRFKITMDGKDYEGEYVLVTGKTLGDDVEFKTPQEWATAVRRKHTNGEMSAISAKSLIRILPDDLALNAYEYGKTQEEIVAEYDEFWERQQDDCCVLEHEDIPIFRLALSWASDGRFEHRHYAPGHLHSCLDRVKTLSKHHLLIALEAVRIDTDALVLVSFYLGSAYARVGARLGIASVALPSLEAQAAVAARVIEVLCSDVFAGAIASTEQYAMMP